MDYLNESQREMLKWVKIAIESFNLHETYIMDKDINERCLNSKFASYLEKVFYLSPFRKYDIDVEYNRGYNGNEFDIKRIDEGAVSLDLIVHERGWNSVSGFNNLICFEMKKSNEIRYVPDDLYRLRQLTINDGAFQYKLGIMLIVEVNNNIGLKISHIVVDGNIYEF